MNITADIQVASEGDDVPDPESINGWLREVVRNQSVIKHCSVTRDEHDVEVCVRIVGIDEIQYLNSTYRHKTGPTNVLSFPASLPADVPIELLGDIVICAAVVNGETAQQHKTPRAHWAHMVIHGTLHLLGYDHENDRDAELMEGLETEILQALGFPSPYEDSSHGENQPTQTAAQ